MKENEIIENKQIRENLAGRVEVLDKVKQIITLPNIEYATTDQVAEYYKTPLQTIETIVLRNRDELNTDGFKTFKKSETIKMLNIQNECLENTVGKSIVTLAYGEKIEIPNRGLRLFTKRAILRVGMLLRDSEIAKEVRTRLLDIIQDTEIHSPEIIKQVEVEIDMEKQLSINVGLAYANGDLLEVLKATKALEDFRIDMRDKRITKLEEEKEILLTESLTIEDSRKLINAMIRKIAANKFHSNFSACWKSFYVQLNYKLGISIKGRSKEPKNPLLNTLTKEEMIEAEKVVRAWAVELDMDLSDVLNLRACKLS